jgi:Rrf2 family nitric oxide-sensitive transcriptional repressor
MRLTTLSDYALRVLLYAAASNDRLITIEETARVYKISRAHLMKVVNILTRGGFLKGVRGRAGGFTLARSPDAINIGAVMRATEPDFELVECFATGNQCLITGCCKLPTILNEALTNFVATLDRYTLADLMLRENDFTIPRKISQKTRGPILAVHKLQAGH